MERVDSARRGATRDAIQGRPPPLLVSPARRTRGRYRVPVRPARRVSDTALFVWGLVMILGTGILLLLGMGLVQRWGEVAAARAAAEADAAPARWRFVEAPGGPADEGVRQSLRALEGRVQSLERRARPGRPAVDFPRD